MEAKHDRDGVKTTATSLTILDVVNEWGEARLTDLADHLGMSKSTVNGHLRTLRRSGYLVKQGETYRLGLKLLHLGYRARSNREVYEVVERKVIKLADRTEEEVEFDVLENGKAFSVLSAVGGGDTPTFQSGRCFSAHVTATGKAILAERSDEYFERVVDRWGLPPETDHTITSKAALRDNLETIRTRGYAINDEELRDGLRAVGVALTYPDGRVLGGLSVGGPIYRITHEDLTGDLAADLLDVADELEREIQSPALYL